jgi:radical SAM superfamily enzyme YgiQ (UPF0313 family)
VVPLGVLAVAASVRGAHDVHVLDLCFEDDVRAAIARAVHEHRPEVVGVGMRNLHTNAYDGTEKLIEEYAEVVAAVRACTDARVVLGGAGFSLRPQQLLERLGGDHGVVGEGERAFRYVVDALAAGQTPPRIVHGESIAAPISLRRARTQSDLDLLPAPARDLVDGRYYAFDGTDNVQTKRGCAFQCTYCDYPDLEGRKVRVRDPDAIADEMLERSKIPGVTHAFVVDSVFNVPPAHALAVCRALVARGSPHPWVCYGSPVAFDDALVRAMIEAGCVGVEIGSDAGTDRMLERLKKPFRLHHVLDTRDLFVKHGLLDCHTFVLGAEGETPEEARATLDFVTKMDPDVAVFIVFMEDREAHTPHRAPHRDALLDLLAREAPRRPGWIVPELGIRFGERVTRMVERQRLRGPAWVHLARQRRGARATAAE